MIYTVGRRINEALWNYQILVVHKSIIHIKHLVKARITAIMPSKISRRYYTLVHVFVKWWMYRLLSLVWSFFLTWVVLGVLCYIYHLGPVLPSLFSVQFSSVQFSSVQFSLVQISSVQFRPVQFSSIQFSSWQYFYSHISLFISVQFSSVQFSSDQFSSVQFSSVQFSCFMPKRTCPYLLRKKEKNY